MRSREMGRYTYTLYPKKQSESLTMYKRSELEKMTTFQLREICKKETLVSQKNLSEKEELIRLIMRFRGEKEYRHINSNCEEGINRLQWLLEQIKLQVRREHTLKVPATIVLYKDLALTPFDQYVVDSQKEQLYEGNLLLVDEQFRIYTCFSLVRTRDSSLFYLCKGEQVPVLPFENTQYFLLYFPNGKDSEMLYDCYYGTLETIPTYMEVMMLPLLHMEQYEVNKTDIPLVIDFGSSNTTIGIRKMDGEVNIVELEGNTVIPSVIAIHDIHGEEKEYVFGYDAIRKKEQRYDEEEVPIFYDMKRWISDMNKMEKILLNNGFPYQVSRKEMLRAFLLYGIGLAKQQFKYEFSTIKFLAPIRQKEKFKQVFKELLPEYEVDCELDEGMAVLFHSIDEILKRNLYDRGRWYQALIIDCGGGTTELTSGKFCIENNRVSYEIQLQTQYENGDTNFGGNNLTYKILQLLKIQIVRFLKNEPLTLHDSFFIEELQREYDKAEIILPTQFKRYENVSRSDYFAVKNNYYYLFELAEQIKKYFFQSKFQYELCMTTRQERKEHEIFFDKWKVSIQKNGGLTRLKQDLEFSFYFNEIEELLRLDIYNIMEKFLLSKFQLGQLQDYDMIKLTGQSCKSRLFTEALKEYVAGKLIQTAKKSEEQMELKMCCLEGALSYFFHCKLGYMNIQQAYDVHTLPYEIMAFTHENKEKILIHSFDKEETIGYISRFLVGEQLDLYLNDETGKRLRVYHFLYDTTKFEKTTQEEIEEKYARTVIQEETDVIVEGEIKFFVWVSKKQWGFYVLPIVRDGELLYKGEEVFFEFEDDTWEENFFDGRK